MTPILPHPITGSRFDSPVPVASGWPDDPGSERTAVATSPDDVRRLAMEATDVTDVAAAVSVCRACPRLVAWRESVAVEKRRSFANEPYWGRPIAGWGADEPGVLIVGLAPAAHGGNRTGRIFTGDRSGDWLFSSLHRVGLAGQSTSEHAGDGQRLISTRMVAAVRCAPPANKPTPLERDACAPWLDAELAMVLPSVRAVVCLGSFAWDAAWKALARGGLDVPRPRPRFAHAAHVDLSLPAESANVQVDPPRVATTSPPPRALTVLGSYHPSQQNTFTGKLTEAMLDEVLGEAARLAGVSKHDQVGRAGGDRD